MCNVYIALQEIEVAMLMLCRLASHLSGKIVALCMDDRTTGVYVGNQGDTVSVFLSRPVTF